MKETEEAMEEELQKASMFAKFVNLQSANSRGLAQENRRRIIATFSTPRSEAQAALFTMQIRDLWSHLSEFRKDANNRRDLQTRSPARQGTPVSQTFASGSLRGSVDRELVI
ncbi:hypothetical protein PAXRUDRAFT_831009 [Paxillus rubicundulus Ve08.2h10]|uniref:Uncharacterized protein n=1 Tax=Paxillus rubicundulus Ve08.2h10 TaxID=930991 RepID=A0A0D0D401_9AGAM|nr:hypothetical protein PAXRUDRAFT_831009 [Paxillus rubicundulus Ve08.2h10]